MAALSSTATSLSSITENSTHGVEGVDLPPNFPRRQQSFSSRSISATGEVISHHEDSAEALQNIHEEKDDARPRRKLGKSGSGRSLRRNSHSSSRVEAEEKRGQERTARERRRRSKSSGSMSSRHSSRSERKRGKGAQPEAKNITRSNSRRRLLSDHKRSNSTSDLQKTQQMANGTGMSRSNSLRRFSSYDQRSSSSPDLHKMGKEANGMKIYRSNSLRRSSSHRRRSINASDLNKDIVAISGGSRHEVTSKKKARRNNNGRSFTASSHRENADDADESSRATIVEERHRHRQISSRSLSSTHSSEWSCQSDSINITQLPKKVNARGGQTEFPRSESEHNASEASEEEERPGAYRVSSHHTSRVVSFGSLPSDSGHSFAESDNDTMTGSVHSFASSRETPVSIANTVVTAQVARDMTEEIEAAREQGRAEGLVQVSNHDRSIVVAVQQPRQPKADRDVWVISRRKKWLVLFGLCLCFIAISSIVGYFLLLRQEENELNVGTMVPGDSAELDAVISFDPPTAEDCHAIANGTEVAGQADMFVHFVDMHVEITTKSEKDAALLVRLFKQLVQINLIPLLVGCNDLKGNIIGNGVVDSASSNETSPCLFQNNPLCLEVVLTVKIYLRRKEDGSTVIEIMSDLLLGTDLNEILELPPMVQTAGVSMILPSDFSTDIPTETPSWSLTATNTDSMSRPPSAMPYTPGPSVEPTTWQMPAIYTANPTVEPTLQKTTTPTPGRSLIPTSITVLDYQFDDEALLPAPSAVPSLFPTKTPSTNPTMSPSDSPSESPSVLPSSFPSASPSFRPTHIPSRSPTSAPSATPTSSPSVKPSTSPAPSSAPTSSKPSISPSIHPSELPTTSSRPSLSGFFWVTCGKLNFCSGRPATVQNANHVTIDGIPSALDEDMIAVRCCSDTLLPGFEGPQAESCPYAASNIGRRCYNTATYWEAENACSSVGGRLCTLVEMENGCAARTGCGHNSRMSWTSTPGSP